MSLKEILCDGNIHSLTAYIHLRPGNSTFLSGFFYFVEPESYLSLVTCMSGQLDVV